MYELRLEQFSGPLEKLLELIEEKQMTITEVNLAEITADFLNYLNTQISADGKQINADSFSTRVVADFVAIAAQLLLIKSKALLPDIKLTSEEEEKIKDLESRLRFYQQFKPNIKYLKELSEQKNVLISRPLFSGRTAFFYPSENVKIDELYKTVRSIFETLQEPPETQTIKSSLIKQEEKIQEIICRIGQCQVSGVKFQDLVEKKSRSEIVVLFLAMLHLLASQLIKIEQKNRFEDITIAKN